MFNLVEAVALAGGGGGSLAAAYRHSDGGIIRAASVSVSVSEPGGRVLGTRWPAGCVVPWQRGPGT